MNKITENWKCSCGAVNPLRHRSCPHCGSSIPHGERQRIYREELRHQKHCLAEPARQRHNAFWRKLEKPFRKGSASAAVTAVAAVAIFSGMLWRNHESIRTDDITERANAVAQAVSENASGIEIQLDFGKFANKMESRFGDMRNMKEYLAELEDIDDIFRKRTEELQEKKEKVIDYVN